MVTQQQAPEMVEDVQRYQQNLKKNLDRDSLSHWAYSYWARGDSDRYKTIL